MMRNKMNAMASTISHAEDCIMEVQHWLEEQNNPHNISTLVAIQDALDLLGEVYHDLREDNE